MNAGNFYLFLARADILCNEGDMPVTNTTRVGTDHSCEVWLNSRHQFELWMPDIFFSIFSSGGHSVQRSDTCRKHQQLGLVLILPVMFFLNPTSSLTCQIPTKYSILSLAATLCSEAEHAQGWYWSLLWNLVQTHQQTCEQGFSFF